MNPTRGIITLAIQVVRSNGYKYEYSRGDHDYFFKEKRRIIISNSLNRMVWECVEKEFELDLNV